MGITTPAQAGCAIAVRQLRQISQMAVLNRFIADEQAFVEAYVEKTFAESDPQIGLAR
jgi:hypothetical protein